MNIQCIAIMITGITQKSVRQAWPANSNREVEYTNQLLTSDGNQKSGVEPQTIAKQS